MARRTQQGQLVIIIPTAARKGKGYFPALAVSVEIMWYHQSAALLQTGSREEVNAVENLIEFLVAVGASIVGSYVSKWLDRHRKGR